METFGQYLNVIDAEATCWDGNPPPGQISEIIEIGLCVVDMQNFERAERCRLLVRPEHSTVSAFCTELTGITPDEVGKGLSFRTACRVLQQHYRADSRAWASWGDYDRKQFERQCRLGAVPYPFSPRHSNVKAVFTQAFGLKKRPGMKEALELVDLPLEGRHHRGEDDAWNIAALVLLLAESGRRFQQG